MNSLKLFVVTLGGILTLSLLNTSSGAKIEAVASSTGQTHLTQITNVIAQAPPVAHPHLLLTHADLERINTWIDSEAWAASARTNIINSADAWPDSFTEKYYLTAWALPPEGGQNEGWHYNCPQGGSRLRYEGPGRHICPLDGQVYSGWPYEQVIYEQMHYSLASAAKTLGVAYQLSGEAHYAQAAAEILLAYADAYLDYPYHDINDKPYKSGGRVTAQTLNEAGWLVNITQAYDMVADSGLLSTEQRNHIEQDLLRAAVATITRNPVGKSNWQSWHNVAIGAVGFALQDPQLIAQALDDLDNGFYYQMQASVSADGLWYEGSISYHLFALQAHCYLAEMAARSGVDLYANPALHKMFTAPLRLAMPNLRLPAFNDDSGGKSLLYSDSLYEAAYQRYRDPEMAVPLGRRSRGYYALLWGVQTLPPPTEIDTASTLLSEAGYAVLRNNESEYPLYLAFDFGPHGGWHGHYDKLGFVSFGRNTLMGIDPGTQPYSAPTHNTWDKVTLAHNTIVVDGQTQVEASGVLRQFVALPGLSVASADAGDAYTTTQLLRTLVVSSDYILDRYHAQARDGQSHNLDWIYHNPGILTTDLPLAAYTSLPTTNGYQHLSNIQAAATSADWQARFQANPDPNRSYGSVWTSTDGITATFSYSDQQAANGSSSGKLSYDFSAVDGYVLYNTPSPEPFDQVPQGLQVAVYGNNSGNTLTLRLNDYNNERFVKAIGPLDWSGWRVITLTDVLSWTHFLGDGVFDLPVKQVTVQIDYQDDAAPSGALYIDDLHLLYPDENQLVEDFETPIQRLDLQMLGQPETTIVTGDGLGPDPSEPVPFVMARRTAQDTVFTSLMIPSGSSPTIVGFAAIPNNAAASDEAASFVITATAYTDRLLMVVDGLPGVQRVFGASSCDGEVCLVRRNGSGQLQRLILANGVQLQDNGTSLLHSASPLDSVQIDYDGVNLLIQKSGAFSQTVYIWGPEIANVQVNGTPYAFTREGDYVVLATEYLIWLPVILR